MAKFCYQPVRLVSQVRPALPAGMHLQNGLRMFSLS
jgi:hypothetical protein